MQRARCLLWSAGALLGLVAGVAVLALAAQAPGPRAAPPDATVAEAAGRVDQIMQEAWQAAGLEALPPADSMLVARRLYLALCGTLPSLEEMRALEKRPPETRASDHLERLLGDRRFADYFAERLARAFVGTQDGPFLIYRRRRFVYWLSDQLAKSRPYDELVRELLTAEGLWTDQPATNYITAQERDPIRLAARTARAFLGLRIDCAQCHDHPFARWKQRDFQGLAAYFAEVQPTVTGIADRGGEFKVEDRETKEERVVPPAVPFDAGSLGDAARRREHLARWVTSRENPYFAQAIANRVWTLVFGQGLVEPVDDLEADPRVSGVLEVLADDFRAHGYDLRRLIRVIAATRAFGTDSAGAADVSPEQQNLFAAFPLTRLRSEQIAGSLIQISSLRTVDADSHVLVRFFRVLNSSEFVNRYGDAGEEELSVHTGTIPQRLVMMNGKTPRERTEANLVNAAGRIAALAPSDEARVRIAYLVCLSRVPTADEAAHFVERLRGLRAKPRGLAVEDMLWALVNATEFSWNH